PVAGCTIGLPARPNSPGPVPGGPPTNRSNWSGAADAAGPAPSSAISAKPASAMTLAPPRIPQSPCWTRGRIARDGGTEATTALIQTLPYPPVKTEPASRMHEGPPRGGPLGLHPVRPDPSEGVLLVDDFEAFDRRNLLPSAGDFALAE